MKFRLFLSWVVLICLCACTTSNGPVLGESLKFNPGWSRLKQSSLDAVSDPNVWGSLLAAALMQIDDLDRELSDQLRENTPLFGSASDANSDSADLRSLTSLAYTSTALFSPWPEQQGLRTKVRVLSAEWIAVQSTRYATSAIKQLSGRDRPNGRDDKSFPSGHTSRAVIQAQMANLNVDYLAVDSELKQGMKWTFNGLAALTGWARIEAGLRWDILWRILPAVLSSLTQP